MDGVSPLSMRAIWSGAVNFGLINIPVKLYSASVQQSLDLDMLHKGDLEPIKYARVCRKDGEEVPWDEIVKGYEYKKGDYVVLEPEDFKKASVHKSQSIDVDSFSDEEEVDPIYYEKPYYLEPEKGAEKPYALLRDALKKTKKVGIATFVLRNREHLAVLKPVGDLLVLNQLRFASEIRKPDDLKIPGKKDASAKQVEMAVSLVKQMTDTFRPDRYRDTYIDDLRAIIKDKAKGKKIKPRDDDALEPTEVKDLMRLLKQSLERGNVKKHASRK